MKERLIRKFEALETERKALEAILEGVSEEQARREPAPGKWSAVQIVVHLATAEERSLGYIRKKTQAPEMVPPAGLLCTLRTLALVTALSSPFKFKAPDVVSGTPDNPPQAEALRMWAAARAELREMIETLPEELMRRALFKHPVAGRMNMGHTLDFMTAHMRRHGRQMRALLG